MWEFPLRTDQVPTLPKLEKFEVCFVTVPSGSRRWQDVSSALLPRSSGHQRLLFLDIFPQGFLDSSSKQACLSLVDAGVSGERVLVSSCEVECVCQTVDCWFAFPLCGSLATEPPVSGWSLGQKDN